MLHKEGRSIHFFLLFVVMIVFIWSLIKPEEGFIVWLMEVLPSVIVLIFLISIYNKFRLTTLSYVIITLLAILTFIGGHYSYSKVPIFNWIKDYFDLQRNHYDRFGHFIKGLMVIVILEILLRKTTLMKSKTTTFIAICITLSIGAFYEIIEWVSTSIGKGGKATKDFLGMQGDIWDAQWDMSLLLAGSILAVLFLADLLYKRLERTR
jgi:putative membrane protein